MFCKNFSRLSFAFLLLTVCALPIFAQPANKISKRIRTFDVQHYTIRTSFDRQNKTIFGDTTIQLKPLSADFNRFELDAVDMKFDSVQLESSGKNLTYKTDDDKIIITLDKAYAPKDLISVRLKYSAKPRKGVYFIAADEPNKGVEHPAQIWTQGEPEEARHWFPAYDFPDDKATTEQFITIAGNETVVANGESLGEKKNSDGTTTFHFKMPIPHSTYLTSFVIGTYTKLSDKYKSIPLAFYTYAGKEELGTKSNQQTRMIMPVFENLTGINYPYNKYVQTIVAKFTFGGMENITATTMSDTEMFFVRPDQVEDLISHELAHSWFGNMVTCESWSELWLNEGFATFMEAAYREKIYGRADYLRKIAEDAEEFRVSDATGKNRHALFNLSAKPDDSLFDETTYQKGGAVLHTLRETVGTENFWKAVNVYLNKHKFQNVRTADLQQAMEDVSKMDLKWFFDQWVYRGGFPRLKIDQNYDAQAKQFYLTVKQTQDKDRLTPDAFILPLEVEIKTASGVKTEMIQIKNREEKFTIPLETAPTEVVFDKNLKLPLKLIKTQPIKNESAH